MERFTTTTAALTTACLLTAAFGTHADTLTVREGLNSYAGTQDTWFSERGNGESAGFPEGTFVRTALWGGANQQALIRFDGVENMVVANSTVNSAILRLTVPDITYADGEHNAVYQMLVDWAETDAFGAAQWAGGATQQIDLDGIEAALVASDDSTDAVLTDINALIPIGSVIDLDVTSIVQSWVNGDSNYGFLLQSSGNAAGNGLFMGSSENADEAVRPTLIIDGEVVPEPGSLALLGLGGLAFLRRRR